MEETIEYIKSFLLYDNQAATHLIGYTRDEQEWSKYRLVIVPGENLLTGDKREWDIPDFTKPAQAERLGEVSDEFGEVSGGVWVIREDIIYNTLFLLSQAELTLPLPRDKHGRLSAEESVLGKQGLATIPVLDEYARLCTKLVEAQLPEEQFSHIYLTHDVDTLTRYRSWRNALGGIRRGRLLEVFWSLRDIHNDPAYTYNWLHSKDKLLRNENTEEIYFFKATEGKGLDQPQYDLYGKDFRKILFSLNERGARFGLHSSYYATETKDYQEEIDRYTHAMNEAGVGIQNIYNQREAIFQERNQVMQEVAAQQEADTEISNVGVAFDAVEDEPKLSNISVTIGKTLTHEEKAYKREEARRKFYMRKPLPMERTGEKRYQRTHFLRINDASDLVAMAAAGITDDFTLGWADHVGFRFGTTRAARFINPSTLELTNLTLHPLCIMDSTLSDLRYMDLSEEEAYYTCQQVIDKVKQHGGELVLLWHNTTVAHGYHHQLYKEVIEYLVSLTK